MNITSQLPSYPYVQWNDDPDITAFFRAFNIQAQDYLDQINSYQLPIYMSQQGALLDWAASSIYGVFRPSLSSGGAHPIGPLNTFALNTRPFNSFKEINSAKTFLATDEEYQKIIQWNTFKGDGYQFTIRWLKRRVQRFLSGILYPDQTYQVSVRFVSDTDVVIGIASTVRNISGGAFYNSVLWGGDIGFNQIETDSTTHTPTALASALQAAVQSGVLLLPFQYTFTVEIS